MQRKSTKIWIALIVAPIAILIVNVFLQVGARAFGSGGDGVATIINLFSLLAGIVAVLGLLGLPLWIALLVIAINHNKKISTSVNPTSQNNDTIVNHQTPQPEATPVENKVSNQTNQFK